MTKSIWLFLMVLLLAACGGGGSDNPTPYGAVAINWTTRVAGMAGRYDSQAGADNRALSECGSGCIVVEQFFGTGKCAAVAKGSNGAIGWAVSTSANEAVEKAIAQCVSVRGVSCAVIVAGCN